MIYTILHVHTRVFIHMRYYVYVPVCYISMQANTYSHVFIHKQLNIIYVVNMCVHPFHVATVSYLPLN